MAIPVGPESYEKLVERVNALETKAKAKIPASSLDANDLIRLLEDKWEINGRTNIARGSVGTEQLADKSVTAAKLA